MGGQKSQRVELWSGLHFPLEDRARLVKRPLILMRKPGEHTIPNSEDRRGTAKSQSPPRDREEVASGALLPPLPRRAGENRPGQARLQRAR